MGLAAALDLARRGASVTVLEQHDIGHDLGSHSGFTRVIRHAYHEGTHYVPLVQEADAAWLALEKQAGDKLLVRTGLLEFGPFGESAYHEALEAVSEHGIEHELMEGSEARKRWPIEIPDGWSACFTPSGGYLRVGPCFTAMRAASSAASKQSPGERGAITGRGASPLRPNIACSRSDCSVLVGSPVEGPPRCTSTTSSGSSVITASPIVSAFSATPGPDVVVTPSAPP